MATETEEEVGGVMYQNTSDSVRDKSKTYYIISGWNEQRKATACTSSDFNDDGSFRSMHDDYWYDKWGFANTKEQGLKFNIEGITEVDATDYGYMYKEKMPEEKAEDKKNNPSSCKGGGGCCGGGKACKDDGLCGGGGCCNGEGIQSCSVSPACEAETIAKAALTVAQAMATQCLNVDTTNLVALVTAIPDPTAAVCAAAKQCAGGICDKAKDIAKDTCSGCTKGAEAAIAAAAASAIGDAAPLAAVTSGLAADVQVLSGMLEGLMAKG